MYTCLECGDIVQLFLAAKRMGLVNEKIVFKNCVCEDGFRDKLYVINGKMKVFNEKCDECDGKGFVIQMEGE
jgi:hypothetical protein